MVLVGGAGVWLYRRGKLSPQNNNTNNQPPTTTPPDPDSEFPDHSQTDLGGNKVNLMINATNPNDPNTRTWTIYKNGSALHTNNLQSGQTWEFKGLGSGNYTFKVNSPAGFGGYFVLITVVGGTTVSGNGINDSKCLEFTIP